MADRESKRAPRRLMTKGKHTAPRQSKRSGARDQANARRAATAVRRAQKENRQQEPAAAPASGRSRSTLLFQQSLLPMVEHVHRIDQTSLRVGVIWLLILPILLLIIRRLTGSSKVAFLIIWIIGMFVISAALILIAYADHELKRFLEDVKKYVPAASETELDGLLRRLGTEADDPDADALGVVVELMRDSLERRRERRAAGMPEGEDSAEETARLRLVEEWLQRVEQRRGKEARDAEHPADHTE